MELPLGPLGVPGPQVENRWSNPSSSEPAQTPACPAKSVQDCNRQTLFAFLGFKGHRDLSALQSG